MRIKHTFDIEEPEERYSFSPVTQFLVLHRSDGGLDVIIYLMLNTAVTITGSRVSSGMGTTVLSILYCSESGAYCASETLRKVRFGFDDPMGMATKFKVDTQKMTSRS